MRPKMARYAGIALISAATLMYELALTRVFALIEWHHMAFLSINVALLGYAASGTLLSLRRSGASARWPMPCLLLPAGIIASYCALNLLPFDSYQLTWSPRQALYLVAIYLSLIVPFGLSGYLLAHWLSLSTASSHRIYAANLVGSSLGCLSLLAALPTLGAEGVVLLAGATAALGAALLLSVADGPLRLLGWAAGAMVCLAALGMARPPALFSLRLSPYKSLSYALSAGDAHLAHQRWNAYSRVDVVESEQIHSAPGLSLAYRGRLPVQMGVTIDGDNLSPISRRDPLEDTRLTGHLPSSIAYRLRPSARTMVLLPRGGMEIAIALDNGAERIVAVEDNSLVVEVVADLYGAYSGRLYADPRVELRQTSPRRALAQGDERFDVVLFALAEGFHPLTSGTYSLAENHLYTIEAMAAALGRLENDGMLVVSRWLQDPPSESIRAAATLIAALEKTGVMRPEEHLLAFRSWSTMVLLASPAPFSEQDLRTLKERCAALSYDLVHYPGMVEAEANRHNRLAEPAYYRSVQQLLQPNTRGALFGASLYDIRPPTDDRPYFGHYFKWRQIPGILSSLGATWQPFGGGGFLLVLLLLALSILATMVLVAIPALAGRRRQFPGRASVIIYFVSIGLGFLMVEIPLMQHFILYLGQPTLAFVIVLAALLLFSALGSALAPRVDLRGALVAIVVLTLAYPLLLKALFGATMRWSLAWRMAMAGLALAPIGALLGIPFAGAIRRLASEDLVPWIWAINGGASVISSVLATLLALSYGHRFVLAMAALCYGAALLASNKMTGGATARAIRSAAQRPPP